MTSPTPLELLVADLAALGITLRAEGERLRFTAPQGAITPAIHAQLQANKPELIALLRDKQAPRKPIIRRCRASNVQRRFWKLQQLNPLEPFYNAPFAFRLCGRLDTCLLQRSLAAIVQRHETLRTTLQQVEDELMQVIAPTGELPFTTVDLWESPASVSDVLEQEIVRPFDLAREPGLRVLLIQTGPEEHILQLCFHNTLFDQNSLLVLLDELSVHYEAFATGTQASLPEPGQYSEYVSWQDSLLTSGAAERQSYWGDWFSRGDPPTIHWNPGQPVHANTGFLSHVTALRCEPGAMRQLIARSQRGGVTPFVLMITAYALVLRRYIRCPDVTLGTTFSNRSHWKFESMIGAAIVVPALRIDMTDDPPINVLLTRVRTVLADALIHQDVPFEQIAGTLTPPRAGNQPLFRAVVSFFPESPDERLQLPGVVASYLDHIINALSRPDVYLVICAKPGDILSGYWMHKRDAFSADTAAQMNADFETALRSLIT